MFAYCNNGPVNAIDPTGMCKNTFSIYFKVDCGEWTCPTSSALSPQEKIHNHYMQQMEIETEITLNQTMLLAEGTKKVGNACMKGAKFREENQLHEAELLAAFWDSDMAKDSVASSTIAGSVSAAATLLGIYFTGGASIPVTIGKMTLAYFAAATEEFVVSLLEEVYTNIS